MKVSGDTQAILIGQLKKAGLDPSTGVSKSQNDPENYRLKRNTINIKVDDFLAEGRPLWVREVQIGAPAPDTYQIKTDKQIELEKIAFKPNKCLFGESFKKLRKVSITL